MRRVQIFEESFPLKTPFRISRGVKTEARLIRVHVKENGLIGQGECCPYSRFGETVESVIGEISGVTGEIGKGASRNDLQTLLPSGAARNALDCALWDLKAKREGKAVFELASLEPLRAFKIMRTVVLDTPEKMAQETATLGPVKTIKLKLDKDLIFERVKSVHKKAPTAKIIIDANEGWDLEILRAVMPDLRSLGVVMIEQPLPVETDEGLSNINHIIPICADESCHTSRDLPRLKACYDFINIKLDKTGGLTEAINLLREGKDQGFKIMLGCMVSTSLAIAPMALLCSDAELIDLDGPLFLRTDRPGGMTLKSESGEVVLNLNWGQPKIKKT